MSSKQRDDREIEKLEKVIFIWLEHPQRGITNERQTRHYSPHTASHTSFVHAASHPVEQKMNRCKVETKMKDTISDREN